MSNDWANESYVRLYVRDTTTWLLLGWDGQSVLAQVLRKLDHSGVMDIGEQQPWEAMVVHCRAPEDAARRGMAALLRHGVLEHNGPYLVAPNFRDAQEATKSDKLRQRECRDRRRAAAVTRRDAIQSQDVTVRHSESHAVTPGHAESPSAVQCGAVPTNTVRRNAREGSGDEGDEGDGPPARPLTWQQVGARYARRYEQATTRPVALHLHQRSFEAVLLESGGDVDMVERSLENFWRNEWAAENRWPPSTWAKQFGRYADGAGGSTADAKEARRLQQAEATAKQLAAEKRERIQAEQAHEAAELEKNRIIEESGHSEAVIRRVRGDAFYEEYIAVARRIGAA